MNNCLECGSRIEGSNTHGAPIKFCRNNKKCQNAYNYKVRKLAKNDVQREEEYHSAVKQNRLTYKKLGAIQREANDELQPLLYKLNNLNKDGYEYVELARKIFNIAKSERYFLLFDESPYFIIEIKKVLVRDFTEPGGGEGLTDDQNLELRSVLWNIYQAEDYSEPEDKGKRDNHYAVARKQAADSGLIYPLPPTNDELKELVLQRLGVSEDDE